MQLQTALGATGILSLVSSVWKRNAWNRARWHAVNTLALWQDPLFLSYIHQTASTDEHKYKQAASLDSSLLSLESLKN